MARETYFGEKVYMLKTITNERGDFLKFSKVNLEIGLNGGSVDMLQRKNQTENGWSSAF